MTNIQAAVGRFLDIPHRPKPTLPPYGRQEQELVLDIIRCGMSLCDVLSWEAWAWLPSGRTGEVSRRASHNENIMSHDLKPAQNDKASKS